MKARGWIFYSGELVRTSTEIKIKAVPVLQQQAPDQGTGTARAKSSAASLGACRGMGNLRQEESRVGGLAKEPTVREGTELKATSPSLRDKPLQSPDFTQPLASVRKPSLRYLNTLINPLRLMRKSP